MVVCSSSVSINTYSTHNGYGHTTLVDVSDKDLQYHHENLGPDIISRSFFTLQFSNTNVW